MISNESDVNEQLLYITQDEQPLLGSNVDAEESEEQAAAAEAAARPITEQHEDTLTQQGLQRYTVDCPDALSTLVLHQP